MKRLCALADTDRRTLPVRYLIVGALNTAFGYLTGIAVYYLLSPRAHILVVGAIANVLAISFSFTTYKHYVFRTNGSWWREYLRSYLVYGGVALCGIVALWIMVDGLNIGIWVAQALAIALTVFISYLGHSRYTFGIGRDV